MLTGTASILGQALANASNTNPGGPSPAEVAKWTSFAQTLITHLVANIQVNTTDTAITVASIIAPPGVSGGPCSGTLVSSGTGNIQ